MKYTKEYLKDNDIVIHTPTESLFYQVVEFFNENDMSKLWDDCKEFTCVNPNGSYAHKSWFEDNGYTLITAKDFLEDREENKIADFISKKPPLTKIPKEVYNELMDIEDSITLTGDEARRYRIQKKIEACWHGEFINIWEFYRDLSLRVESIETGDSRMDKLCYDCIKEIGLEDLKFYFKIEETMTMKEAIEKDCRFLFEDIIYESFDGSLFVVDHNELGDHVIIQWILKNQNEQVKIIKE